MQNFDNCRYLQKCGMCCLHAEVWYLPITCRTLTIVSTCRNVVCSVYLQKYGFCQLPAELWQLSLPAEMWHVLSTCRNMVLAYYLQIFDKCRYFQKCGMCCLPAEVWYMPTICRTLTGVGTCRNVVCAVYLQKYGTCQLPAELWQVSVLKEIMARALYLQISDTPYQYAALHAPTICYFLKYTVNALVTLGFNPLTPRCCTASLTSKRYNLYIYSTNIGTEYFKHGIYSPFFSSSKWSLFHISNVVGSCIIHILYTGCAKI